MSWDKGMDREHISAFSAALARAKENAKPDEAPQINYDAIAAHLRMQILPPNMNMSPGDYGDSLGIYSLANALEAVGKATTNPN